MVQAPGNDHYRYHGCNMLRISEAENRALLSGPVGKKLYFTRMRYTSPLFATTPGSKMPLAGVTNGSAFVVDSGKRFFGVTACHVVDSLCKLERDRSSVVNFSNVILENFRSRIIDRCEKSDLATFALRISEARDAERESISEWPFVAPENDVLAWACGFPGISVKAVASDTLSYGLHVYGGATSGQGDSQFTMRFDNDVLHIFEEGASDEYLPGGMSGGPVFKIYYEYGELIARLCGVIKEGGPMYGQNIMFCANALLIKGDGHISKF